ncbi:MAG: CPCC family cysteine-rich protein [Bryobacteraceae bacterium]
MPPKDNSNSRYACRCCGFHTLSEPNFGSYEICPVCFWEDDPVQNDDPTYKGCANSVSLKEARTNFITNAAAEPRNTAHTRGPLSGEVPPPLLLAGLDAEVRRSKEKAVRILLLGIARSIKAGRIGVLDGCSAIAATAWPLNLEGPLEDVVRHFTGVAGEIDDFPSGNTRDLWDAVPLAEKDAELREYERRVRSSVLNDCQQLEALLVKDLSD